LKYAYHFIIASFSTAFKKIQLQEQWVQFAVGNLVLLLVWFLPLALVVGLIGFSPLGFVFMGLIGVLMLFSFYAWGEITRLPASRVIANMFYQEMHPGEAALKVEEELGVEEEKIEEDIKTAEELHETSMFDAWLDILVLILILPWLRLTNTLQQNFGSKKENQDDWLDSYVLMVPLIAVEGLSLNQAVTRINEITDEHLRRFQPGLIKVDLIARLGHWVFCLLGILVGFSAAVIIINPLTTNAWQRIIGLGIGLLIAWVFITLGGLFSAFTRSFYHTALYQWVRNVSEARQSGDPQKAVPPAILQGVLGKSA
jgi:hypothetical protein